MKTIPFDPSVPNVLMPIVNRLCRLPLIAGRAPAGFPSPAADHYDKRLGLTSRGNLLLACKGQLHDWGRDP